MNTARIGFIGAGHIAEAIVGGICKQGYIKPDNIYIYDIMAEKYESFSKYGVKLCTITDELVNACDYVFLTVKPNNCDEVLGELKNMSISGKCFVSVMAGVPISKIKSHLGSNAKVIRTLPNTPILLTCGATAIAYEPPVSDEDYRFVYNIFDACGLAVMVKESNMDTVIAVSSSAPAYYFLMAETAVKYAVSCGMDRQSALELFAKTLEGSAKMLTDSGMTPDELVTMVASPGGTTEAAIKSFEKNGFAEVFRRGMDSAAKKSGSLLK